MALIVIVIICLIAAVVACFGIFFSSEDTGSDKPMRAVVQEINQEYQTQLDDIKGSVTYDTLEMSRSPGRLAGGAVGLCGEGYL